MTLLLVAGFGAMPVGAETPKITPLIPVQNQAAGDSINIPPDYPTIEVDKIDEKMNRIKLDENMLYGQSYGTDSASVFENAFRELLSSANDLRISKGKEMIKASDIKSLVKELKYIEFRRYVILIYAPAKELIAIKGKTAATIETPQPDIHFIPTHTSEKPRKQLPAIVAPTQDQSVLMELIRHQESWIEIKGFMTEYKRKGKIMTGVCENQGEVPEDAFSILIDEMGGILAILSPKKRNLRINHRTNLADAESNYPDCKYIVWYREL